jgi:hypothetical protein
VRRKVAGAASFGWRSLRVARQVPREAGTLAPGGSLWRELARSGAHRMRLSRESRRQAGRQPRVRTISAAEQAGASRASSISIAEVQRDKKSSRYPGGSFFQLLAGWNVWKGDGRSLASNRPRPPWRQTCDPAGARSRVDGRLSFCFVRLGVSEEPFVSSGLDRGRSRFSSNQR